MHRLGDAADLVVDLGRAAAVGEQGPRLVSRPFASSHRGLSGSRGSATSMTAAGTAAIASIQRHACASDST
ncbi:MULTISPECIES: hypothetical protein [unclassified Pseudonocardia]|uniref:hypothetical protein n=1 Tax=unclassified Pseudonocardia TaxID=2619320 RepID=UPI0020C9F2D7|nr:MULTISPECIES: hypothetical protein [unclassified Pseudonocardia]